MRRLDLLAGPIDAMAQGSGVAPRQHASWRRRAWWLAGKDWQGQGKSKGARASSETRDHSTPSQRVGASSSQVGQNGRPRETIKARIIGFDEVWSKRRLEEMFDSVKRRLPPRVASSVQQRIQRADDHIQVEFDSIDSLNAFEEAFGALSLVPVALGADKTEKPLSVKRVRPQWIVRRGLALRPLYQAAQTMVGKSTGEAETELAPRYGWRSGMRHVELWHENAEGVMRKVMEANMKEVAEHIVLRNISVGEALRPVRDAALSWARPLLLRRQPPPMAQRGRRRAPVVPRAHLALCKACMANSTEGMVEAVIHQSLAGAAPACAEDSHEECAWARGTLAPCCWPRLLCGPSPPKAAAHMLRRLCAASDIVCIQETWGGLGTVEELRTRAPQSGGAEALLLWSAG